MPVWASWFEYAEQFGIPPNEVGKVPLVWWERWHVLNKAKAARQAFDNPSKGKSSKDELRLKKWALDKDGR